MQQFGGGFQTLSRSVFGCAGFESKPVFKNLSYLRTRSLLLRVFTGKRQSLLRDLALLVIASSGDSSGSSRASSGGRTLLQLPRPALRTFMGIPGAQVCRTSVYLLPMVVRRNLLAGRRLPGQHMRRALVHLNRQLTCLGSHDFKTFDCTAPSKRRTSQQIGAPKWGHG